MFWSNEIVIDNASLYDENYQNFLRTILSMDLDFSPLGVTEVIDKTTDITKASKNIKKVNEVSEDITKEVKIMDKSNDTGKIAKNTRKMKLIKNEQTLDDIFTKKNSEDF